MHRSLEGITIPAVTPFTEDGALDLDAMEHNFGRWSETAIAGYMVLGTNGEFRMLGDEEARTLIEHAVQWKGDKALIAGVGRESLHQTLSFLEQLKPVAEGIDYVSVLTPHYFAKLMDGAALVDYYSAIADASPVPVLLYVAPSYANGVVVRPDALVELAGHPNIAGIKDTSGNMMVDYMAAAGGREDFTVLAGSLSNLMTNLSLGGAGGICSVANCFPDENAFLTTLWAQGRIADAWRYFMELRDVAQATTGGRGVASLKAAMNARGYRAGHPRRPVQPLAPEQAAALPAAIEAGLTRLHALMDQMREN